MAKTGEIRVLLVRAGPTDWDDAGRLQGDTDLPLSPCGRDAFEAAVCAMAQPKPVGSAANGTTTNGHHTHNNGTAPHHDNHIGPQAVELDVVLHGPDECSQQSAKIVSQHFGGRVKLVDDFREMDLGLWEGLRECELLDRQPTAYKQWRADPSSVQPPDGDTVAEAELRVLRALKRALEKAGRESVALVLRPLTHAVVRAWLTDKSLGEVWRAESECGKGEWFVVPRSRLKDLAEELRAGT